MPPRDVGVDGTAVGAQQHLGANVDVEVSAQEPWRAVSMSDDDFEPMDGDDPRCLLNEVNGVKHCIAGSERPGYLRGKVWRRGRKLSAATRVVKRIVVDLREKILEAGDFVRYNPTEGENGLPTYQTDDKPAYTQTERTLQIRSPEAEAE